MGSHDQASKLSSCHGTAITRHIPPANSLVCTARVESDRTNADIACQGTTLNVRQQQRCEDQRQSFWIRVRVIARPADAVEMTHAPSQSPSCQQTTQGPVPPVLSAESLDQRLPPLLSI